MAKTLLAIRNDVRVRLKEPTNGRFFTDTMLNTWIHEALKEVCDELQFEKKRYVLMGSDYVAALGTAPRYFKLPDDFMSVDSEEGIKFNGIRRLPTSARDMEIQQQKALVGLPASTIQNITVDDYFSQEYTGLIMHYATQYIIREIKNAAGTKLYDADLTAGNNGYLMWFVPNPEDTTSIEMSYNSMPSTLTSDTDYIYLMSSCDELVTYGACERGAESLVSAGRFTRDMPDYWRGRFETRLLKAKKKLNPPEKRVRIQTAKQAYGMYSSNLSGSSFSTGSE